MYSAASRRVTCTYTIMNERTVMTAGEQQLYHSLSVHTSSHTIVVKSSLVPLVQLFIAYRKRGLHTRLKKKHLASVPDLALLLPATKS